MKLRDNKWGFDISLDNPFRIFRVLRDIAIESVGIENIVDLSRGDPGYGFSPSVKGREFYAFLLEIDVLLNNPKELFVSDNKDNFEVLWEKIQKRAKEIYQPKKAEILLEDFYFFLTRIEKFANQQGVKWDKRQVLFEVFKYCTLSGGCYLDPKGEVLTRLVIADHYNEKLGIGIDYEDLILVQGVSHGIGVMFKTLCDPCIGYLNKRDTVAIASPAYAIYNAFMNNRGLNIFPIPININTGKVDGDIDEILGRVPENLKLICLVDPNNPTGFMCDQKFLEKIAAFAKEKNALIVSDEVYSDFFFERKKSIMNYAPERTIVIGGRSKIERSTGLRFGEIVVKKEGQKFIAEKILNGKLDGNPDLMALLICAKAPGGGVKGEFMHTTFVTGPSQYLGIIHVIFGKEDRDEYLKRIRVSMESFYSLLGLEYNKNLYYASFDLLEIPGCKRAGEEPEELFAGLARKGVVLIPENLFFSEEERAGRDRRTYARACIPNLTFSQIQIAGKLIREYVAS